MLIFFLFSITFLIAQSNNYGIQIGKPSVLIGPYNFKIGDGVADVSLWYSHSLKNKLAFGIKMQSDLFYNDVLPSTVSQSGRFFYNNYALTLFAEKSFTHKNILIKPSFHVGPTFWFLYSQDYEPRLCGSLTLNTDIFQIAPELKIAFINGKRANYGFVLTPKLNIISSDVRIGTLPTVMLTLGLFAELNRNK